MTRRRFGACGGFTLLEVLVALTVLAVGVALALTLVSGSLGNIRKVQSRALFTQQAESVMELALLDESIKDPVTLNGDFENGTRWTVVVAEYELPSDEPLNLDQPLSVWLKLLSYTVEVTGPRSSSPDCRLTTLKLIGTREPAMAPGMPPGMMPGRRPGVPQ